MKIKLTTVTEEDIDNLLEIEKASFPSPWSKKLFLNELANPNSHIILAKDETDTLLGFACFWIVANEAHILNIVVHPGFRRQGIAKRLLGYVMEFSIDKSASCFVLEVRDRNKAAIEFYKGLGFKEVGLRKGYYADTGENAILMELVKNVSG